MTYRYGETSVNKDIQKAATYLVCVELLTSEARGIQLPEGTNTVSIKERVDEYDAKVNRIIKSNEEIRGPHR